MSRRYPLNAPGDFYVEDEMCLLCLNPQAKAPSLMGFYDSGASKAVSHCYFAKQPQTGAELEEAIAAVASACCGALRYSGDDPAVLNALAERGLVEACDPQERVE